MLRVMSCCGTSAELWRSCFSWWFNAASMSVSLVLLSMTDSCEQGWDEKSKVVSQFIGISSLLPSPQWKWWINLFGGFSVTEDQSLPRDIFVRCWGPYWGAELCQSTWVWLQAFLSLFAFVTGNLDNIVIVKFLYLSFSVEFFMIPL